MGVVTVNLIVDAKGMPQNVQRAARRRNGPGSAVRRWEAVMRRIVAGDGRGETGAGAVERRG